MEPFVDESRDVVRYGFKLMGYRQVAEFYLYNDHELDQWLDVLTPLVIWVSLEEDYYIFEKIGEGFQAYVYRG